MFKLDLQTYHCFTFTFTFRDDLHYMSERRACDNPDEVLEEVQKVKVQQRSIMARLQREEEELEKELEEGRTKKCPFDYR